LKLRGHNSPVEDGEAHKAVLLYTESCMTGLPSWCWRSYGVTPTNLLTAMHSGHLVSSKYLRVRL